METSTQQLSGAKIIMKVLREEKVDTIFWYPGGAALPVYDALYGELQLKHYRATHEQQAIHAADGYARSTGKVGVCMATSWPGALNLVTGIATADADSSPIVVITANVPKTLLGKNAFQEADFTAIVKPISKAQFLVTDVKEVANALREAFFLARSWRPGPVVVDITKNALTDITEYIPQEPKKEEKKSVSIDEQTFETAIDLINSAQKPFVLVGGGVHLSGANEEVYQLVKKINAPVCNTLMGKGDFPETDELYMGMIGMHGTKTTNKGIGECDFIIALGTRFSDRVTGNTKTFAKKAKILHIDIDPLEIGKNVPVTASIVGDLKDILHQLDPYIQETTHEEWIAYLQTLRHQYTVSTHKTLLTCPSVIEEMYQQTKGEVIITTEVGQHQMRTAQYYKFKKKRSLITSGGFGTMGFGLGAAIGVQIGNPDKRVINVAGDGCFRMNSNELLTAVENHLPIIQIVINNNSLGMVRQWQSLFCDQKYSATDMNDQADFVAMSRGLGARAFRATTLEEFKKIFQQALQEKSGPTVIVCEIGKDDKVFPMVAPGASIEDCFDENDV